MGDCFNKDKFISLLKQVSGREDGGWDSKIRLPMLGRFQLKSGSLEPAVSQSEVGPLLLAINELNAKAISAIIEHDQSLNLRESMRGPKDQKNLVADCWTYNYTKRVKEQDTQKSCKFSNLGMALIVACDKSKDSQVRAVLATLLQQAQFLPDARDFESFVTMWRDHGSALVLKPFLQASSMQLLFQSYPYESQRRITRLLLGLILDEEESKVSMEQDHSERRPEKRQHQHVYELNTVTGRRPFIIFVLIEMMENRWRGA